MGICCDVTARKRSFPKRRSELSGAFHLEAAALRPSSLPLLDNGQIANKHARGGLFYNSNSPNTSLAPQEMYFELFKESMVIAAGVLLFIVAWTMHKRNRITGRPPVVSYAVPWVGSALDLGRCPDAFFKRAM